MYSTATWNLLAPQHLFVKLCQLHTMQKPTQFNLPFRLISRVNCWWKIGDWSFLSLVHSFISQSRTSRWMLFILLFCNSKRKYYCVFFLLFSCSLAWPGPHNCWQHHKAKQWDKTWMANGFATASHTGPTASLLWGNSVSGGTSHPAHKGNKESSLLQCQIKTNMDHKGQKGDTSTELAMVTLSHCRRTEQL